jgi:uncharacterized LabA/DUF88 family protein
LVKNNKLAIKDIYFFTAEPNHRSDGQIVRHKNYCKVLREYCNINVIDGKFSHKKEKQTDTNLVARAVSDVLLGRVSNIYIISNDSDMVPIINVIKKDKPTTNINIVKPPSAKYLHKKSDGNTSIYDSTHLSFDIKKAMDSYYDKERFNRIRSTSPRHFLDCLLPDTIEGVLDDNGNAIKNPYK